MNASLSDQLLRLKAMGLGLLKSREKGPGPPSEPSRDPLDLSRWEAFQKVAAEGVGVQLHPEGSDEVVVRIGLDFGTSYTKVVVCWGESQYVALPFHHGEHGYTLPSRVVKNGPRRELEIVGWSSLNPWDSLKLPLLGSAPGVEAQTMVIGYLALVLRFVRGSVFREFQRRLNGRRISWEVNIGIPSEETEGILQALYREILAKAWEASCRPVRTLTYGEVFATKAPDNPNVELGTVPEFAAQVAAYVKSSRRRTGIHLLHDVGGGTVDTTLFVVKDVGNPDRLPILGRKVANCGIEILLSGKDRHQDEVIKRADASFAEVFLKGKAKLSHRSDLKAMTLFRCGGGREEPRYAQIFHRLKKSTSVNFIERPIQDDFDSALPEAHRLLVARGLAESIWNLPEVIPPDLIPEADRSSAGAKGWADFDLNDKSCV